MNTVAPDWLWAFFIASVLVALFVDFVVLRKQGAHEVTVPEAIKWSVIWVALSFAFNALFWWALKTHDDPAVAAEANTRAVEFLTGYLIEKSLAVDNIFVFLMIFTYFAVPPAYQKRVLMIGIVGAIVLRTVMILVGGLLIAKFHWILYVFGAFLLITGIKMWWFADETPDLAKNPLVLWLRRHMKITDTLEGERFFVRRQEGGGWVRYATPLFLVLVLVELSDVIFAVDSIPAIFAITTDPFVVLTSNIFAILGLRAMYFLLADMADRFSLLKYGLALVLIFIGAKMLLIDVYKIPVLLSLGVVAAIIGTSVVLSLAKRSRELARKSSENRNS